MHLQTSGAVQGRGQGVLLQGGESCCGRGVRYEVRYFVFVILMIIFIQYNINILFYAFGSSSLYLIKTVSYYLMQLELRSMHRK